MEARNNTNVGNIIFARDVAEAAGCHIQSVYVAYQKNNKNARNYNPETLERIRTIGASLGYDPVLAKKMKWTNRKNKGWTTSTSGNFASRAEETARMLFLRQNEAMTNMEIGRKIGVSDDTVRARIGNQPKELTKMSFALRGERVAHRNKARKNLLLNQKLSHFKALQQEVEEQTKQTEEMEAEATRAMEEANRIMLEAQRIADEARGKREALQSKVIELDQYRKEAKKAAKSLGRVLA